TQTPNQIAPVEILHGINVGNPWFSTSSFATPVGPVFGSVGRHALSGPGMYGLNLSLFRRITLTERFRLEIRADSFNASNTPQFSNPSASLTAATYGAVTGTIGSGFGINGTGGGRSVQFGLKVSF